MQEIIVSVDTNKNKVVALVQSGKLVEKYEEFNEQKRLEGNIYIGRVENVLVGMQAAFVDIGEEKNTFIHIRDVIPRVSDETGNKNEVLSKHDIKNYIRPGMPILVQVKRDSTNRKGARVSTNISLSGRFAVLMPNSILITAYYQTVKMKNIVKEILPKGYGAIIRTSAMNKDKHAIKNDIDNLVKKLEEMQEEFKKVDTKNFKPQLLYKNNGIVSKILTDVMDQGIERIWTNNEKEYSKINEIIKETNNSEKIKLELKKEKLLSMYDLDDQIEKSNNRKIWLRCGGFITIDKTEALTAIDVNSGKYTGNKELEQTVFTVNKEATIEIAKQIRLRDIGGIIIIDYIDMEKDETKEKIVEVLKEQLKKDRSKTQVIGFTPLNLLEMTRKHICSND